MTREQIDKIGNTLIYLSKNTRNLTITKALKLLYMLEEEAIKKTGIPFFNINFEAWKYGPVAPDVYSNLNDKDNFKFNKYIKIVKNKIQPVAEFSDDEFTDYEIKILEQLSNKYKNKPANYLTKKLHDKNSLWTKVYIKNSNKKMNMKELIKNDKLKLSLFDDYKELYG